MDIAIGKLAIRNKKICIANSFCKMHVAKNKRIKIEIVIRIRIRISIRIKIF